MKILHHGYTYPNYCKCSQCECEFIYDDDETIHHVLSDNFMQSIDSIKPFIVWTSIQCPECKGYNTIYNYNGKINKVRKYYNDDLYQEIDFDENTMERR